MAAWGKEEREAVNKVIDDYTKGTLDTYTRAAIKDVAALKMDKSKPSKDVADAVYDYIRDNFCGNIIQAAMCQQICPSHILPVLRNEIIAIRPY